MSGPFSITSSVTAAIQSTESLCGTIKRFKDHSKVLRRLQDELQDLATVLDSLAQVNNAETSVLALLQRPIDRCSLVCREFEQSIKVFSGKSETGFRDWAKMQYMRGDINEFIDIIAGYKSTISVGLGTINMHASKVSQQALQEYSEMIQDTTYKLGARLQQIDEKAARHPALDYSTATATAQDPISLTQRPSRHNDTVVHSTEIVETRLASHSSEEPVVLIQHCPGCSILFCLWILLAFLSLAVGLWRSFKTSDEGKGFTDAAYVVAVGGLIIYPIQNRHAYTCKRKRGQSEGSE